ncbi:hypothetical protein IWQ62_004048, partial [Dispira parvispora]
MTPPKRRGRPPKKPRGAATTSSPSSLRTPLRQRSNATLSPSPSPTTRLSNTRKGPPVIVVPLRQTTLFSTRLRRTPERPKPPVFDKSSPEISSESEDSEAFVPSNESKKSTDNDTSEDDTESAADEVELIKEESSDSKAVAKSKKTPKPSTSQITLEEYIASRPRGRPPKHLAEAYKAHLLRTKVSPQKPVIKKKKE